MVKRGLVIGINYNNDKNARLYGCINDAIYMHNLLIDAYGYNKSNITMLRDDNVKDYKMPTRTNILNELKNIVEKTQENDEVWIHYSGHGSSIMDRNNDEYDRKDEILIPSDYKQGNIIVDDELYRLFEYSRGTIYITLDCCHSGTGWDLPYLFRSNNNRLYRYRVGKSLKNKNIYMLSGSRDYQTASDTYSVEQVKSIGAFTNAFIECSRFHNHNVNIMQLHNDINLYLKTKGYSQLCEFTSSNLYPDKVKLTRTGILDENKKLNETIIKNNMRRMKFT